MSKINVNTVTVIPNHQDARQKQFLEVDRGISINKITNCNRVVYVRCPTCNKVLANKEHIYQELLRQGHTRKYALDELELDKCCRIRMLGHVDLTDELLNQKYYNFINPLVPPPDTKSKIEFPYFDTTDDHQSTMTEQIYSNTQQSFFNYDDDIKIL